MGRHDGLASCEKYVTVMVETVMTTVIDKTAVTYEIGACDR